MGVVSSLPPTMRTGGRVYPGRARWKAPPYRRLNDGSVSLKGFPATLVLESAGDCVVSHTFMRTRDTLIVAS